MKESCTGHIRLKFLQYSVEFKKEHIKFKLNLFCVCSWRIEYFYLKNKYDKYKFFFIISSVALDLREISNRWLIILT